MWTPDRFARVGPLGVFLSLFLWAAPAPAAELDRPSIASIRIERAEVIVIVDVPGGVSKVTLEGRPRLGAGAWEPKAVQRLDGSGGRLSFRLPASAAIELLRVRGDPAERLPASFYQGTNSFAGLGGGGGAETGGFPYPTTDATTPGRNQGSTDASRSVAESDIWQLRGSTLYFFNQSRGLQIIDLSQPDDPVLRGQLDLPAVGEQMYVLPTGKAVLLARNDCAYSAAGQATSEIHVVNVEDGMPSIAASVPVEGTIQESRMVGDALYVVSQQYRPRRANGQDVYEWGSVVSSYDLSNPAQPQARSSLWHPGWGNVVTATDRFLFVATQDPGHWWRSVVHCVDVSSSDGTMKALASIRSDGRVPDKFKINVRGDVLTIISENWNTSGRGVFTSLETFSLEIPAAPEPLGQLTLARGEQLHATRFDGDRVYVVTFFRIDPLWIVDLSDPRQPRILGELHVPGWSTYIHPLGDRLVSIGIDDANGWKVAVSLFDVKDPARPALLDKVALGENHSWSEANYDEKAFAVLPDAGTILVPYQGDQSGGYASRVQIIDLGATTLQARGTIEHRMQPRRATVLGDRIVSVDAHELVVVDATHRDQPVVKAQLELAWPINKVILSGDYLLEISQDTGGWFGGTVKNAIRVARAEAPGETMDLVKLDSDDPILGSTVRDNKLFLLQGRSAWQQWVVPVAGEGEATLVLHNGRLILSAFDLASLPTVTPLGATRQETGEAFHGEFQALCPKPGLIVWSGGGGHYWFWDIGMPGRGIVGDALWRPWGGSGSGLLLAADVVEATAPRFVSTTRLNGGSWWSFSDAFAADGMVYLSHQASEFLEGVMVPGQTTTGPSTTAVDRDTGKEVPVPGRPGVWATRHYLDVVDYADPASPTVRKPVNIPGTLRGLSHDGAVLYTVGVQWRSDWTTDWNEWLAASAYDGVSASLIHSMPLREWPHPLRVHDGHVVLGRGPTDKTPAVLEVWTLADTGRFGLLNSTVMERAVHELEVLGSLLVAQQDRQMSLFDASDPETLRPLGNGAPKGCLWYPLKHADGDVRRGLWLPLNEYGVDFIPVQAGNGQRGFDPANLP